MAESDPPPPVSPGPPQDEEPNESIRRPPIRPVSRDNDRTGKPRPQQNKLKSTPCFHEIDRRLRLGWSTSELVKAVQEEFKELLDTSPKYIRKLIDRHRATIPPMEL